MGHMPFVCTEQLKQQVQCRPVPTPPPPPAPERPKGARPVEEGAHPRHDVPSHLQGRQGVAAAAHERVGPAGVGPARQGSSPRRRPAATANFSP